MFSSTKRHSPEHRRIGSHSTTASAVPGGGSTSHVNDNVPLVSPLQLTFDFELASSSPTPDSPFSPFSSIAEPSSPPLRPALARPTTSHGLPADIQRDNDWRSVGQQLQPPTLPQIMREASTVHSTTSEDSRKQEGWARDESDNFSTRSRKSILQPRLSFEHPMDMLPSLSRPATPQSAVSASRRQTTAQGHSDSPIMESSLFPSKALSPSISTMPAMSRSFIDSRDKPYSQPPPKPFALQHNHSSPDLLRSQVSPLSPALPSSARNASKSRISPRPSLQDISQRTNYSGSTARASTRASTFTANSSEAASTIGTPYQSTADSFPLPQLVATRPKTSGPSATVGGVAVLTHHTSAQKPTAKPVEKRKTRLLNPLALLQRRRSNQDSENVAEERSQRQAQAQALARQRDVVASGVNKPPEDFDPRIKGKVVHDFSAPRRKRNTFDEMDTQKYMEGTFSLPTISTNGFPPRNSSLSSQDAGVDGNRRRSTHTPIFVEHLSENPEASRRLSSLQAENLENKDFLQRASKQSTMTSQSQESAILPPFARRSQILDPMQASLYQDDDSKRSSDPSSGRERDSTPSSFGGVSPIMQSTNLLPDVRASMSPVSPGSPSKHDHQSFATSYQAPSNSDPAKLAPQEDLSRSISSLNKTFPQEKLPSMSSTEVSSRPYSTALGPPIFTTISEGSNESSPVELAGHQVPQLAARGASTQQADPAVSNDGSELAVSTDGQQTPSSFVLDHAIQVPTCDRTPEPERGTSIQFKPSKTQAKLVEKRISAVGHSRKSSGPRHQPSNASRFSFQYGSESAAQEHALEEKHRKLRTAEIADSYPRGRSPSEADEDDYFDESAMDDLDEMEMQDQQIQPTLLPQIGAPSHSLIYLQQARQMLQQPDSDDDESAFGDGHGEYGAGENDVRNADLLAYSGHGNHTRQSSYQTTDGYWGTIDYTTYAHSRGQSQASEFNFAGASPHGLQGTQQQFSLPMTNLDPVEEQPGTEALTHARRGTDRSQNSFELSAQSKAPLPRGDSGYLDRTQVVNGLSFNLPTTVDDLTETSASEERLESREERVTSGDSYSSQSDAVRSSQTTTSALSMSTPATSSPPPVASDGARITSGFDLNSPTSSPRLKKAVLNSEHKSASSRDDSAGDVSSVRQSVSESEPGGASATDNAQGGHSRFASSTQAMTLPASGQNGTSQAASPSNDRRSSNMVSSRLGSTGLVGFDFHDGADPANSLMTSTTQVSSGRQALPKQPAFGGGGEHDDMYFDDGNFSQDIGASNGGRIDENAFDDDSFLARPGMMQPVNHRRDRSSAAFTTASFGSDGPYPSFAMPDAPRASQRYSQMMLEDLPLQAPVDPKFIPQRNPSEDMKRLGLSDRVPPVPVPESDEEAYSRMKANLERYHAALAQAANKAAVEGRFLRMPSDSTARSESTSSKTAPIKPSLQIDNQSIDGESVYSDGEGGGEIFMPYAGDAVESHFLRTGTTTSLRSHLSHLTTYSPPRMNFDFGFDRTDDIEDVDDSFMNDDDLVAAANAEALANDEEGFYGQEFDFYGRPRANSNELETVNGGYFGPDGDDGLARNKSLREPNLTPITERSEFSTRNSFIGLGLNTFGPPSAGPLGPPSAGPYGPMSPTMARMPVTPLIEGEVNSFEELRKLRANAFGGGDAASLRSSSNRSSSHSLHMLSPAGSARPPFPASTSMPYDGGSSHSAPGSAHPASFQDSPQSAASNRSMPFSVDPDATPRKNASAGVLPAEPTTAKKLPAVQTSHSRNSSGGGGGGGAGAGDSVTYGYVRTPDPEGSGKPRWMLERRRTSEQGQLEIIGRELVQGGWI